ncbi:MAG: hypothetical protein BIFFINMI_02438 [Phycisphaerae bacterium]|nr:hypothetical protein [Phycisphaerae bacterium]
MLRRWINGLWKTSRRLAADEQGSAAMEYALLLAVIAIPLLAVFRIMFALLVARYQMTSMLSGWPFP